MILIVDDDPTIGASLGLLLKQHGYRSRTAQDPAEALAVLAREPVRLVLQDMNFSRETSGREGLDLLGRIRGAHPDVPVILITAWGTIDLAVEGMKKGAADFVTKPWSNAQLVRAIETALSLVEMDARRSPAPQPSRQELDERWDFSALVGEDPAFVRVLETAGRVSPTDAPVLVTGESGTGKELVAEAIHRNSRRAKRPFVRVNIGGISSTLFESEMFGHVRGAFTDARENRKGRFEVADGGTIFLDEIGEMDASSQVKLLRVLQDRTFEVLGSSVSRTADVRVVSATNRDLGTLVAEGRFREDLFYRLNLIALRLPALRERPGDVPLLTRHFVARFGEAYRRPLAVTDRALRWLGAQPWPGNVRQLRQTIERAVLVADRDRLDVEQLQAAGSLDAAAGSRPPALPAPGTMTLEEVERALIESTLCRHDGNLSRTADALGLSRAALYRRLRKHGLDVPGSDA